MKLACNLFGHKIVKNKNTKGYWENYICSRDCGFHSEYKDRKWEDTLWESEAWEAIKILLIGAGVLAALFLVIFGLVGGIMSIQSYFTCNQYKDMGIDVIWKLWTGCMANHPKFGYIPVEEYFRTLNLYKP